MAAGDAAEPDGGGGVGVGQEVRDRAGGVLRGGYSGDIRGVRVHEGPVRGAVPAVPAVSVRSVAGGVRGEEGSEAAGGHLQHAVRAVCLLRGSGDDGDHCSSAAGDGTSSGADIPGRYIRLVFYMLFYIKLNNSQKYKIKKII